MQVNQRKIALDVKSETDFVDLVESPGHPSESQ